MGGPANAVLGATAVHTAVITDDDVGGDGVSLAEEFGPDGNDPAYDGNDDGIPDGAQGSAASLFTADGQSHVTLATRDASPLASVRAVDNPSPADAPDNFTFPYGFFEFTISGPAPGAATILDIHLPAPGGATAQNRISRSLASCNESWPESRKDFL